MSAATHVQVTYEQYQAMSRAAARELMISHILDEWIDACVDLMSLYPDMVWDEVLSCATPEATTPRSSWTTTTTSTRCAPTGPNDERGTSDERAHGWVA